MTNEFISAATNTLKEVAGTMQERGAQYSDSWGKDAAWYLTKAIVKKHTNVEVDEDALTAIGLAVFIDQKYSRLIGGYKKDTVLDMVPYLAALANKVKE
jgi:hypothetical protein